VKIIAEGRVERVVLVSAIHISIYVSINYNESDPNYHYENWRLVIYLQCSAGKTKLTTKSSDDRRYNRDGRY
jgi:hypothetical protein